MSFFKKLFGCKCKKCHKCADKENCNCEEKIKCCDDKEEVKEQPVTEEGGDTTQM